MESALVADCGSNTTRVVLIEVVDNAYRFVARGEAPSTAEAPYNNVTLGIFNAVAAIEAHTGRKLLANGKLIIPQAEDGTGVDAFLASSSAAEPLRLVAAGLVRSMSADVAARASHATYTTILDTISLDDYGDESDEGVMGVLASEADYDPDDPEAEFSPFKNGKAQPSVFTPDVLGVSKNERENKNNKGRVSLFGKQMRRGWRERQIAKLRRLSPNLIVLSGGVDGSPFGPTADLLDVILEANRQEAVLAMATGEAHRPMTLVFAGNKQAQDAFLEKVNRQLECFLVDNIRPDEGRENLEPLQTQLSALYQERLLPNLPGYRQLVEMSQGPLNTSCRAVGLMTQYLAKQVEGNRVLASDLGGNNGALFYATGTEYASMVRGDFGLSYGLSNVLAEVGVENVQRWIPFESTADEVIHYALNKTLRPHTIPADERERYIEGAFTREALRHLYGLLASQRPQGLDFNRVIGLGGPLVYSNTWNTALILLDALQPVGGEGTGLIDLELDSTMLMSAAGTLAAYNPNAAAYIFQFDCLNRLGPVIVPVGQASPGAPAVTVTIRTRRGRARELVVPYGEIAVLPLRSDEQATLEIQPARGFRIGNAAPGVPVSTQEFVSGGSVGIIIDARGRPIRFPAGANQRQETVARWFSAYRNALQQAENEGPAEQSFPTKEEKSLSVRPVSNVAADAGSSTGVKNTPPAVAPKPKPAKVEPPVAKIEPPAPVVPIKPDGPKFKPETKPKDKEKPVEKPTENPAISELSPEDLLRQELTGKNKKKKK